MLSLTEPIESLTHDLSSTDKGRSLVVHPTLGKDVNGPSIQRITGLKRTLQDQWKTKGIVARLMNCCLELYFNDDPLELEFQYKNLK